MELVSTVKTKNSNEEKIYDLIVMFDAFGKQLMTFKLSDFFTLNSHQNTFKELSGFLFTFCKLKLPFLSKSLEEQLKEDFFFRFLVKVATIVKFPQNSALEYQFASIYILSVKKILSLSLKLRHYEKATKFKKISAVFTQQHQNKWEIFSHFCGLLRKAELQSIV